MTRRNPLLTLAAVPLLTLVLGLCATLASTAYQRAAGSALSSLAKARQTANSNPAGQAAKTLISGDTVGLAQSALQSLVLQRLGPTGLVPDRIDPATPEVQGVLTRLPLTLALSGSEPQIMAAVLALEQTVPLLHLDLISIDGQGVEGGILQAEIAVSAFAAGVKP